MIRYTINLIGLGGIGSWTANKLIRLGCQRLLLFDDDKVETHNIENQDYDLHHIGRPKVNATDMKMYGITEWHARHGLQVEIVAREERVGADSTLRGIVIVAVDSTEARKEIFKACCHNPGIPLYIEAGAAHNQGVVRVLVPHDKDQVEVYERLLELYSEEGPAPCVSPYMAGQFASIIAYWVWRFNEGWRPRTVLASSIDYRHGPNVVTEPIL